MKASRVSRIVRILTAMQAEENLTPDDLANMCEISRRTLFRDLKELQAIGVPYQYVHRKQTHTTGPYEAA